MANYQAILEETYNAFRDIQAGEVASYIPELAKANAKHFAIALMTVDGQLFSVGDAQQAFTIQSMSKPFTYGMALEDWGRVEIFKKVAVEPVGISFNSINLDSKGRPPNPMLNAGAIALADMIKGASLPEKINRLLAMMRRYMGHDVHLDASVFTSERQTGFRNIAIANLLRSGKIIEGEIEEALDFYFQQCSLLVTCNDLAGMAAALANNGLHPKTGERVLKEENVSDVLSVMYTCGMYDSSGEWAYNVGIPAKSGVSGGIFGVVPKRMGIAVFSPPLNEQGHSERGLKVFEALSEKLCLHIFDDCTER
jgi:glutaminase